MDSQTFHFTWHAYGSIRDDNDCLDKIEFYVDDPACGVKTCLVLTSGYTIKRHETDRDLGVIHFPKPILSGVTSLWNMCMDRKMFLENKEYSGVTRYLRATKKDSVLIRPEGPFEAKCVKHTTATHGVTTAKGRYTDHFLSYYIAFDGKGEPGDCGVVYFFSCKDGFYFMGLHMARAGEDSLIVPIFRDDARKMTSVLQSSEFQMETTLQTAPGLFDNVTLHGPTEKPHVGRPTMGAQYCGKWTGKVAHSPPVNDTQTLHPEMVRGVEGLFGHLEVPCRMHPEAADYRNEKTFNIGPTPHTNDSPMLDPNWSADFCAFPGMCRELTVEEAVFGRHVEGIDSMASSSKYVGPFMDEQKNILIDFDAKKLHPMVEERIKEYDKLALSGEDVIPLCVQFVKKELLPIEKVWVSEPCPRIINGHDLAYNIWLKCKFGDFISNMNKHWSVTPSCIGINPFSTDWAVINAFIEKFPNLMEGDLSKEESTTGLILCLAFAAMIKSKYVYDKDLYLCIDKACAGLHGFFFLRGDALYRALRGHSSGHLLTALFNTFCVWAVHKDAFEVTCPELSFKEHTAIKAMGDDTKGSVSDVAAAQGFNMRTVAKCLRERHGMIYTDAAKDAGFDREFADWETSRFLGRDTYVDPQGRVLGRLKIETIMAILAYKSSGIPGMTPKWEIQVRANCAFRELCLYGPETYDKIVFFYNKMWDRKRPTVRELRPKVFDCEHWRQEMFKSWGSGGKYSPWQRFG